MTGVVDVSAVGSMSPRVYIPAMGGVIHGFVLQGIGIATRRVTGRHHFMTAMSVRFFLRRMVVHFSRVVAFMTRGMRGVTPMMRFLIVTLRFHYYKPFL
jgi:hypothetical protein